MEKIGRTKIVDLLKREDIGAMVNVKGWVRTRRGSKQVNFIALNDGSTDQQFLFYQSFPFNLFFLDTRRRGLKRKIHFFLLSFPVLCQVVIY